MNPPPLHLNSIILVKTALRVVTEGRRVSGLQLHTHTYSTDTSGRLWRVPSFPCYAISPIIRPNRTSHHPKPRGTRPITFTGKRLIILGIRRAAAAAYYSSSLARCKVTLKMLPTPSAFSAAKSWLQEVWTLSGLGKSTGACKEHHHHHHCLQTTSLTLLPTIPRTGICWKFSLISWARLNSQ